MANTNFRVENGILSREVSVFEANVTTKDVLHSFAVLPVKDGAFVGSKESRFVGNFKNLTSIGTTTIGGNVAVDVSSFVITTDTKPHVSIGVTSTNHQLEVNGSTNLTGNTVVGGSATFNDKLKVGNDTKTHLLIDSSTGKVRIGGDDISNSYKFAVYGNSYIEGDARITQTLQAGVIRVDKDLIVTGNLTYTGTSSGDLIPSSNIYALGSPSDLVKRWQMYGDTLTVTNGAEIGGVLNLTNSNATHTILGNTSFDNGVLFVDETHNRVGINTTKPTHSLNVVGTTKLSGNSEFNGNVTVTGDINVEEGKHSISGNTSFDNGVLFVDGTNNRVGINTKTPTKSVDVVGDVVVSNTITTDVENVNDKLVVGDELSKHVVVKSNGTIKSSSYITTGLFTIDTVKLTLSNTNSTLLYTIPKNIVKTFKVIFDYRSISDSTIYGSAEMLVVCSGYNILTTTYAELYNKPIGFVSTATIQEPSKDIGLYVKTDVSDISVSAVVMMLN